MSRLGFTEFGEELVEDAHEITESEAVVGNHALDLVELGQMGGVQGFVSEHPVNGEILDRRELLLRGTADGQVSFSCTRVAMVHVRDLLSAKLPTKCTNKNVKTKVELCLICGLIYGIYIGKISLHCL